jgi:branched-chain amino acid transport system substrate-binding protein
MVARLRLFDADIIASESFDYDAADLEKRSRRVMLKKPDALFVVSDDAASAAALITYARKYGAHTTIFGSDAFLQSDLLIDMGAAAEGLIVLAPSLGTSNFSDAFMKRFGESSGIYAAQAYDAMTAIGRAVQMGAMTSIAIKDALSGMSFDGASGEITFDTNGDIGANYSAYIAEHGAFVPMSSDGAENTRR